MKYKITYMGYPLWVRMIQLDEIQKEFFLNNEYLDDLWEECESEVGDYNIERELITCQDRIQISVEDENGNTVFDTESIDDIKQFPYYDDDDNLVSPEGYVFKGVADGLYIVNQDTMKGSFWECDLELIDNFDPSRLYMVQDDVLNDEFCPDNCFPMGVLYYQKGDSIDLDNDRLDMNFMSDNGSYGYSVNISSVKEKDWWTIERE